MKKQKRKSKELHAILNAINNWGKKHKGNVLVYGGICALEINGDMVEDSLMCYGPKKLLKTNIDRFMKEFNKEKTDFVKFYR